MSNAHTFLPTFLSAKVVRRATKTCCVFVFDVGIVCFWSWIVFRERFLERSENHFYQWFLGAVGEYYETRTIGVACKVSESSYIRTKSWLLRSIILPPGEPLQYPLIFPDGQDGWHHDLNHTCLQHLNYQLMYRGDDIVNPILRGKSLGQQYIVDQFAKCELSRLRYVEIIKKSYG